MASWFLEGLKNGFKIGLIGPHPKVNCRNLPTTPEKKVALNTWIHRGLSEGFVIGPFKTPPYPDTVISPIGAVVQKNKIRPIFHLSAPTKQKTSVNDSLDPLIKTVTYITFINIVKFINNLGKGSLIWVADMQDAYMHVPVHKSDWKYLGFRWLNVVFYLTCLPFGLSSSCRIYENCGDMLIWALALIVPVLFFRQIHHYLDDFFGGHSDSKYAKLQFKLFIQISTALGFTLKTKKCHPPNTRQQILGWIYDTITMAVYAPITKIQEYSEHILTILNTTTPLTKATYESLLGKLRWLCIVFPVCRIFLINLHFMVHSKSWAYTHAQYPSAFVKEDLKIFYHLLSTMKRWGQPFQRLLGINPTIHRIQCDASTTWGLGGWYKNSYTAFKYNKKLASLIAKQNTPDIQYLELLACYMCIFTWKEQLTNGTVLLWSDNLPIVCVTNRMIIQEHRMDLLYLLQKLSFILIKYNIQLQLNHVAGKRNHIADLLSRGDIQDAQTYYFNKYQQPLRHSTTPTQEIKECLNNYIDPATIKRSSLLNHHIKQFHDSSFFSFIK